jgi:hypothetical protein
MRENIRRLFITRCSRILIIIFVLIFLGCEFIKKEEKCIFVLFDVSGSTFKIREWYYRDFLKIVNNLKGGERLIVDLITENPLARSTFPINEKIYKFSLFFPGGKIEYEKKFNQQKNNILNKVKELVMNSTARPQSSILDSLRLAERVFKTYKLSKKELILFSDMIEETKDYNFITMNLSNKEINQIIEKERRKGLPDLSGVKVYIATGPVYYKNISSEKFLKIREFWLNYFKQCNADLVPERYGTSLLEYK